MANPPTGTLEVHYVKLAQGSEEITANKIMHQLMVSTIRNSSVQSLHQLLANIYVPVLFGDAKNEKGDN